MYQVIKVQTTMIRNLHLLSAQFCQELCCCQKRQVAKLCKVSSVIRHDDIATCRLCTLVLQHVLKIANSLSHGSHQLSIIGGQHGNVFMKIMEQTIDICFPLQNIRHISESKIRSRKAHCSIFPMLQKLFGIIAMFTPQSIIYQDVRVKEYAFHRLNRALRRGSLSISSSVNDAQPLHFRISDDTGIVLYGFFVLATTFVFLAGVSVFTKVSTFFSIPSSSAMMLSSRSSSAFNCSVVIILTCLILGCKDKQLIRINNILIK